LTGGRLRGMVPRAPGAWQPQVAVFERGDRLVLSVDLPGIRREDVQVDIDDRAITICGERRPTGARADVLRAECGYGRFLRSVPLPEGADTGAAACPRSRCRCRRSASRAGSRSRTPASRRAGKRTATRPSPRTSRILAG